MILQSLFLSKKVSETKNLWSAELTQSYPHLQYRISKVGLICMINASLFVVNR